jgi:hypothetical protein
MAQWSLYFSLCACALLQAWWRYISANVNGVKKIHQESLFSDLRSVAEIFIELDLRISHLKQSAAYKGNAKLQHWLKGTWLNCMPLWVAAYRAGLHTAICWLFAI